MTQPTGGPPPMDSARVWRALDYRLDAAERAVIAAAVAVAAYKSGASADLIAAVKRLGVLTGKPAVPEIPQPREADPRPISGVHTFACGVCGLELEVPEGATFIQSAHPMIGTAGGHRITYILPS